MQEPIFVICSHCATVPKYLIVKITSHSLSASSFISFILDGIISSSFPCHAPYDNQHLILLCLLVLLCFVLQHKAYLLIFQQFHSILSHLFLLNKLYCLLNRKNAKLGDIFKARIINAGRSLLTQIGLRPFSRRRIFKFMQACLLYAPCNDCVILLCKN